MDKIKHSTIHFLYKNILKNILFKFDPEGVHDFFVLTGEKLGKHKFTRKLTNSFFNYKNPTLEQDLCGLHFTNPIGLAAGFDKNGRLTQILPEVGFGFIEVGSVTAESCDGNSKPRLWRLPKSKSIVVNYGLMNDGCNAIVNRLENLNQKFPIGVSIAKTNCPATADDQAGIADYVKGAKTMEPVADYLTINISCPNAYGGQPFNDAKRLDILLAEVDKVSNNKPTFIKMNPDLSTDELDQIIEVVKKHKINGFICSNLTKVRNSTKIKEKKVPQSGGLSGKLVEELSNQQIAYLYQKTNGKYLIIGCGGVFKAEDAYKKILLGASLVQMITGMLFEGPQVIGQINYNLAKLLKADGYKSISEAVGRGSRR